ncbi:hypothetical protein EW146_g6851 [Bondarzewia mesenterica]|uniref:GDP/GTP exchange factor Sec2 N-terminal domain-containing protein n=1 Tax=Bondarzewia mesenterica TaxID=1095465 RepID=A0A4S4LN68_9AGAM|nr:hypothetical protein EW146_g6851 [Bondarzewia mesenterica]
MKVVAEENCLFGSICRAQERANNAERILRKALDDLNDHPPRTITLPDSPHSNFLYSPPPTTSFSDRDSGYMSTDNTDSPEHTTDHAVANTDGDTQTPSSRRRSNDDAQARPPRFLPECPHILPQDIPTRAQRTQHLSALNTGLLVEKAQVTAELTRLMEKATDEAARRGQAESARAEIEKDLDDLSAGLFNQANTMVAEARFARAQSERKAEDAERALKEAEEVVGLMQQQMQGLQDEKEDSERRLGEMAITMGKGKWVERAPSPAPSRVLRLLSSHRPYQEFLFFVAHLRSLRLASPQPPAMSTLLPLPFLGRLLSEDTCVALVIFDMRFFALFPLGLYSFMVAMYSDPTVRLDLAPSLNWLTRRSVLSAIHNGQLSVEPTSSSTLLESSSPHLSSGLGSNSTVCCALCGTVIISCSSSSSSSPSSSPHAFSARNGFSLSRTDSGTNSTTGSWSTSIFKNPLSNSRSTPPSPPHFASAQVPAQVYIFRLALQPTSALPVPLSQTNTPTTSYPLCTSGWCLARLRSTCSLWAFVRTGIVEKVWEEEISSLIPQPPPRKDRPASPLSLSPSSTSTAKEGLPPKSTTTHGKPPVPPRRRSKMGSFWGVASALGMDRTSNRGEGDGAKFLEPEKEKLKENGQDKSKAVGKPREQRQVHAPPPMHPSLAHPQPALAGGPPPPLPKRSLSRALVHKPAEVIDVKGGETVDGDSVVTPSTAPLPPATNGVASELEGVNGHTVPNAIVPESTDPQHDASVTPLPHLTTETTTVAEEPVSEGFLTPTEELPAEMIETHDDDIGDRSTSPAAVPLPESTPNTPARSRSTMMTHAAANVGNPPPLPRRAAARRLVPPPPPPSAPALESEGGAESVQKDEDVHPSTGDTLEVPAEPETNDSLSPPAESPTLSAAEAEAVDGAQERTEEIEVGLLAEEGGGEKDAVASPSTEGAEKEEEEAHAPTLASESEAMAQADRLSEAKPEVDSLSKATVFASPNPSSKGTDDISSLSTRKSIESAPELPQRPSKAPLHTNGVREPLVGEDGEVYVGDATWEERTWKELVRLREEMFLARVGAFR